MCGWEKEKKEKKGEKKRMIENVGLKKKKIKSLMGYNMTIVHFKALETFVVWIRTCKQKHVFDIGILINCKLLLISLWLT